MGLRATVYSRCTSASAGSLIGTRCYPGVLPEDLNLSSVHYAVRYLVVSYNDAEYREYGNATARSKRRVQIDCYGDTSDRCAALADAVATDFDGWTNADVGWSRVASRIEDGWNDDIQAYREIVDVMLDHKT